MRRKDIAGKEVSGLRYWVLGVGSWIRVSSLQTSGVSSGCSTRLSNFRVTPCPKSCHPDRSRGEAERSGGTLRLVRDISASVEFSLCSLPGAPPFPRFLREGGFDSRE